MYIVKELVKDWSCMGVEGVELDAWEIGVILYVCSQQAKDG